MGRYFWCSLWNIIVESRRLIRAERNIQIHLVKENHNILTFSIEHMIGEMELLPTDIIPIFNKA